MPGEVYGQAFIEILPETSKFAPNLTKEVTKAADDSGKSFSDSWTKAGKTAAIGIGAGIAAAAVAGGALYKLGEDFDSAYDKIRVNTGATGAQLQALEGNFKQTFAAVPTSMDAASTAVSSLSRNLGTTGAPLTHLSEQVLELSRLTKTDLQGNITSVSGAFNNWGIATKDQGTKLDELFTLSQKTGIGVSQLADAVASGGSQLRQAGLSFEQSAALVGLLGKAGVSTSAIMPALSRTIKEAAKEGKDAGTVFQDTFNAIKNAPTDTAAAGAAIEAFGARAGPNLAGLIRQGKLSFDDLAKSMKTGGDTILGAAQQTNDFGENWKKLVNGVLLLLEPAASKVFAAVGQGVILLQQALVASFPYLDRFQEIITEIANFVKDHALVVLSGLVAAIVTLVLPAFISWATAAYAAAAAQIAAMGPALLLAAAVGLLVAGIIYAYQHFSIFRDTVQAVAGFLTDTVWPAIKEGVQALADATKAVVGFVQDGITWLQGQMQPFVDWWNDHWAEISTVVHFYLDALKLYFTLWWDLVSGIFQIAVDVIKPIVTILWTVISSEFKLTMDLVITNLKVGWDLISGVFTVARDLILGIVGVFLDLLTGHWSKAWNDLKDTVGKVFGDITNTVGKVFSDLLGGIGKFAGDFLNAGKNIGEALVKGLIQAITSLTGDVGRTLKKLVEDALSSIPGGGAVMKVLDHLPGFDKGGWVPGPAGAPQLAIVHGGEFVLSADMLAGRGGGGGGAGGITIAAGAVQVGVTVAGDVAPGTEDRITKAVTQGVADALEQILGAAGQHAAAGVQAA